MKRFGDSFSRCLRVSVVGFVAACLSICVHAQTRTLSGTVRDQLGAVIPSARITVQASGYSQSVVSRGDGSFRVEEVPGEGVTVIITAPGFAKLVKPLSAGQDQLDVELSPAPVSEQVVVTANRTEISLGETAESIDVLSHQQLQTTAAEAVDDALHQVPGFTLFRRSGSRTANPTSQGASLRGVGASGASRALVLYNGIPLNDPFGGWVYWGRVPREAISSIEVLNGSASSLYGSGALGGTINLRPIQPDRPLLIAEISGGSMGTPDLSAATFWNKGQWGFGADGEVFRTGGYIMVPEDVRGSVDTAVNSYHSTAQATVQRRLGPGPGQIFLTGSMYDESRNNGTPLQINDTQLWQVSSGLDWYSPAAFLQFRGYGSGQSYNQTFSSVAADRNSESLVRAQHVPAQQNGGSLTLSLHAGSRNLLVGGADVRNVRGFSNELVLVSSLPNSQVSAGGYQLSSGVFLQDDIQLHRRLLLTVGARYDNWNNYGAQSQTKPLAPTVKPGFTAFHDESEHAFSPRGALLFKATDHVSFNVSAYKNFRAPTLNELYRAFRLGNVLTLANSQLQSERLKGIDSGVNVFLKRTRLYATFFHMEVSNPVANVTLSSTPLLITRQRQNLGHTRSQGIEAGSEWHFNRVEVGAGYQFVDATVTSFPANRLLEGLELPQVAPHQFTFHTSYIMPQGWSFSVQGRASNRQFDDDLNQFPLDGFFQLDTYVSRRLHNGTEIFGAIENLTNRRVMIARTPLENLGPPIFVRAGIKLHFE